MKDRTFVIKLDEPYYKPNDLLEVVSLERVYKVKVIKVYKLTLWRRILLKFGIPFKYMNCVLVKELE